MASPAHIELIGEEPSEEIVKESAPEKKTKKQLAQARSKSVRVGGGAN